MSTGIPNLGCGKKWNNLQKQPLLKTKSVLDQDKGEGTFYKEVPALVPNSFILMQIRNPISIVLIDSYSTVLIGQPHALQLVIMELL